MTSRRPTLPAEHVIRLRLPFRSKLALAGCVGFAALGAFILIVDPSERLGALASGGLFGGVALYAWGIQPTEIVFGESTFTLRRRLLPDKQIAHREITGFGSARLVARTGRFSWMQFENSHDVTRAFDVLREEGRISEAQLDDRALHSDLATAQASLVAVWTTLVLVVIAFGLLWFARLTSLSATLIACTPLAVGSIVHALAYYVYLRRLRREDA